MRPLHRAIAFGLLISIHSAFGVRTACLRLARIPRVAHAQASSQRIAHTAPSADALHSAASQILTYRIRSTATLRTARCTRARHPCIALLSGRARALCPASDHTAQCISATNTILQTRIHAHAAITSFLRRALLIVPTFRHIACSFRILGTAIRARTVRSMIGHAARHPCIGAHAACLIAATARIQTQSIYASLLHRTIAVRSATGHASAALAQLSCRTGTRLTLCSTLAVRAFLTARTFRIVVARVRTEDALLIALTVRIAVLQRLRTSLEAVTNHASTAGALHRVLGHRTLSARTAHRSRLCARIGALLLNTRQMTGAFTVRSATGQTCQILTYITGSALIVPTTHWLADAALAAFVANAL